MVGHPTTVRIVPRCGDSTPFGVPVDPEVKKMLAVAVPSPVSARGRGAPCKAANSTERTGNGSETSVMHRPTEALRSASATRACGQLGSTARYAAPAWRTPSSATTRSGVRAIRTATCWPGTTPMLASAEATEAARSTSSP